MNKQLAKTKKKKGFTLIELVVVIAILGILAAILIPVVGGFITRANNSADQANARGLFNSASMALAVNDAVFGAAGSKKVADHSDAIEEFFGEIPTGTTASFVVGAAGTGFYIVEATFGNWTYNPENDPMFSES